MSASTPSSSLIVVSGVPGVDERAKRDRAFQSGLRRPVEDERVRAGAALVVRQVAEVVGADAQEEDRVAGHEHRLVEVDVDVGALAARQRGGVRRRAEVDHVRLHATGGAGGAGEQGEGAERGQGCDREQDQEVRGRCERLTLGNQVCSSLGVRVAEPVRPTSPSFNVLASTHHRVCSADALHVSRVNATRAGAASRARTDVVRDGRTPLVVGLPIGRERTLWREDELATTRA